ncbi:MAG: hypothetical protein ABEI39_02230 [Halobacteriales archaeon]
MSVPELVRERLQDEAVRERVSLGGDDELVVTRSRTLIYRGEGLLSGESVEEHPHDAERVGVTDGRRKSTIQLDHGIDGDSEFTVPADRLEDVLEPVLGGVLAAAGVTDGEEAIEDVYRLGELTIVVTEARVIKHVGGAVWDEECEVYDFADVTGLDLEEGEVSSQVIVEVDRRPQRIKTPTEDAREVREHIERPLLAYHGVDSYAEFRAKVADEEEDEDDEEARAGSEPETDPEPEAESEDEAGMVFEAEGTVDVAAAGEASGEPVDVAEEVAALRAAVERQNDLLERHQSTIEQLVEELRRGR